MRRYWRSFLAAGLTVGLLLIVAPLMRVPFLGQLPALAVLAVLAAIAELPGDAMSWAAGAKGEALTARAIERLKSEGFVILDDRRLPTTATDIDHLVIGPTGIATVRTDSAQGGSRADDGHVAVRRDTRSVADEARRDAIAVSVVLNDELGPRRLTVRPILCIGRARPPLFGSRSGVSIVDGRGLVRLLRKGRRRLSDEDVRDLARVANDRLRPVAAPIPQLYGPLLVTHPADRPAVPLPVPSPLAVDGDQSFMPPVRRAHIQAAREARARATDQRMYWSRGGLAQGKAPPTIPPGEPESE